MVMDRLDSSLSERESKRSCVGGETVIRAKDPGEAAMSSEGRMGATSEPGRRGDIAFSA